MGFASGRRRLACRVASIRTRGSMQCQSCGATAETGVEGNSARSKSSSELLTPDERGVGRNGGLRAAKTARVVRAARRQRRRNCRRRSAAQTQTLNQPVELNVRSSEVSQRRRSQRLP